MNDPCPGQDGRGGRDGKGGRSEDSDKKEGRRGERSERAEYLELVRSRIEAIMKLSKQQELVEGAVESILEQFGNANDQECM